MLLNNVKPSSAANKPGHFPTKKFEGCACPDVPAPSHVNDDVASKRNNVDSSSSRASGASSSATGKSETMDGKWLEAAGTISDGSWLTCADPRALVVVDGAAAGAEQQAALREDPGGSVIAEPADANPPQQALFKRRQKVVSFSVFEGNTSFVNETKVVSTLLSLSCVLISERSSALLCSKSSLYLNSLLYAFLLLSRIIKIKNNLT